LFLSKGGNSFSGFLLDEGKGNKHNYKNNGELTITTITARRPATPLITTHEKEKATELLT
jgi:hypothetical protein